MLVKDTEDSPDGKNELFEVSLITPTGIHFMMRKSELCVENSVGLSVKEFTHLNK